MKGNEKEREARDELDARESGDQRPSQASSLSQNEPHLIIWLGFIPVAVSIRFVGMEMSHARRTGIRPVYMQFLVTLLQNRGGTEFIVIPGGWVFSLDPMG